MQIPSEFKKIPTQSLIITLKHDSARIYRIDKDFIEELDEIETPDTKYKYTDTRETFSFAPGKSIGFLSEDIHNKEHYEKVFLNYFSSEIESLAKDYGKIFMFTPKNIKNLTKEKLNNELLEKTAFITGNFYKQSPLELIKKIIATNPL